MTRTSWKCKNNNPAAALNNAIISIYQRNNYISYVFILAVINHDNNFCFIMTVTQTEKDIFMISFLELFVKEIYWLLDHQPISASLSYVHFQPQILD